MSAKAIFLCILVCTTMANGGQQDVTAINNGWKFVRADVNNAETIDFNDSAWTAVTLPHTWNDKDTIKGGRYYRGPSWYRLKMDIPASAKEKRVFVRFEAASIVADAYFNGVHLGQHRGAFTAFCYELTPHIRWDGVNILAVRVDNSPFDDVPPISGDFNIFGGIYRSAWLIIKNPVCITPLDYASPGVYLKQTKVSKETAEISVLTRVSNGLDKPVNVESRIKLIGDNSKKALSLVERAEISAGQTVGVSSHLGVPGPHLWNGRKDPYLYEAKVELLCDGEIVDSVTQPIGLRYFSVDLNKGFFLNGQSYPLHGVNRHQDRIGKGWAISYADQDEDANIIMEIGATCLRLAHYPHSDYFYSLCDKNGLVVWAELPLVNQVFDTPEFRENAKQQLIELIRQRCNHPSIFFWSLYNELGNSGKCDDPRSLITELNAIAKQEDSTRLTTAASNDPSSRWPGLRNIADLIAWNTYPGWYYGTPPRMNQFIDNYKRDANEKPVAISEYGAGASIHQHEQNMKSKPRAGGPWHPEEWQAIVHEENYAGIEARHYLWGTYVWIMFDFASAGRREGDTTGVNDKGLVTADRKTRKDAFYFYKAKWTNKPFVYITSRRHVERKDPNTPVKVYSNCGVVELKVNGQSLGSKAEKDCIFKWRDVQLKEGLNTIEAIATRGSKTYTDRCEWRYLKQE